MVIKADRRFGHGLTFQWNYTLSKLLTDSDTYFANSAIAAMDHYNRRLEKSIGQFDQTHSLKLSTLYELPFGPGKPWASSGLLSHEIGGWRISTIQVYSSKYPVSLLRNNPLPIFNSQTRPFVDSYENWRAPVAGDKFDPAADRFLKPANQFPAQPTHLMGNATRYNPKVRAFPNKNENVSVAKTFRLGENSRLDLRGEAFNILNRTIVNIGNTNLNSNVFGQVTSQANDARQMRVALKLYW